MTAMTISDTERREVARRLRSVGLDDIRYSDAICEVMMCADLTCVGDEDCHGSDERPECVVRVFARLADLIEPSEPKVRCVAEVKVDGEQLEKLAHDAAVELTGIDRDALLALADEMEEFGNLPIKNPGIRVLQNDDFSRELGYARRIREACGVVE